MKFSLFTLLLLFTSFSVFGNPAPEKRATRLPADLDTEDGIVFKEVEGQKLVFTLFRPLEKKYDNSPLLVYIHGGGWGGGDRFKVTRSGIIDVIRGLNKEGITCASIEYRLVDGKPTTAADAVADCKDAVRYFVKNAETYGIDPDRIGTFGSSAGGHLTLVTALGKDDDYPCDPAFDGPEYTIRCVASYYPQVSFTDRPLMTVGNFRRPQRLIPLLGGPLEEHRDMAQLLSPIDLITLDSPAIFLAHGDADTVLSVDNAIAMEKAAKEKDVPVECVISKGAGHGFSGAAIDPTLEEITGRTLSFLLKYLAH
ncbi:MAG: esterase [Verrucomicrobiales bacterium]|nr:esterase [Verrucomicrobiales bacterium]